MRGPLNAVTPQPGILYIIAGLACGYQALSMAKDTLATHAGPTSWSGRGTPETPVLAARHGEENPAVHPLKLGRVVRVGKQAGVGAWRAGDEVRCIIQVAVG